MKIGIVMAALSLTCSVFANRIWVEKDSHGADIALHITVDDKTDMEKMRAAFPHIFDMTSFNPIEQTISIACTNSACEIIYADENRDYRQFLDSGLREFDFNSEIAIQFYQAFDVEPKTWNPVGELITEKFFALSYPSRMYFYCVRSAENPKKWPHCRMRYYVENLGD